MRYLLALQNKSCQLAQSGCQALRALRHAGLCALGSGPRVGKFPRKRRLKPHFADDLLTFSVEVRSSGFSDFRVFLSVFSQRGFVEKGVLVARANRRRLTSRQQAQHGFAKTLQTQRELDAGRANGYPLHELVDQSAYERIPVHAVGVGIRSGR